MDLDIMYSRFNKFFPMLEEQYAEWNATNLPPVNRDIPMISGTGSVAATLNCTMGNWDGEPTSYAYQWQANGAPVGTGTASYTTTAGDAGKSIVCVVTATNAAGSTAAPPSNAIAIAVVGGLASPPPPAYRQPAASGTQPSPLNAVPGESPGEAGRPAPTPPPYRQDAASARQTPAGGVQRPEAREGAAAQMPPAGAGAAGAAPTLNRDHERAGPPTARPPAPAQPVQRPVRPGQPRRE